jgi:hypothetical protein
MSWEASMVALFEDLEQQASGLRLAERDVEVAERTAAEYAQVSLASRLHASLGHDLQLRLMGGRRVGGRLARVGEDWLLVVDGTSEWIVRHQGLASVAGVSGRADSVETWSVLDRLSLRSVLRGLAADADEAVVHLADDQQLRGRIGRVGLDFLELHLGEAARTGHVVPFSAVVALQGRS